MASVRCPFFEELSGVHAYPLVGYCNGYFSGRLRVPSVEEVCVYCRGDFRQCPTFLVREAEEVTRIPASPLRR